MSTETRGSAAFRLLDISIRLSVRPCQRPCLVGKSVDTFEVRLITYREYLLTSKLKVGQWVVLVDILKLLESFEVEILLLRGQVTNVLTLRNVSWRKSVCS